MTHVHLIGIGGTGLSAIALVLLEKGTRVSGSDRQLSPLAEAVRAAGARVFIGHSPENVQGADLVVRSSAIPDDNPEVLAARSAGIPVLKRSDYLGRLMEGRQGIAIAGTHGKTTTTSMITWILSALGHDPSFIVGGVLANLGRNAHAGRGPHFVIEADEYDGMFLGLLPEVAVVTNIEHDHPDCYPTPGEYYQAFLDFAGRLTQGGVLLACSDDPGAARLLQEARAHGQHAVAYGVWASASAYRAENLSARVGEGFSFDLRKPRGELSASVALQVPGEHNVRNALAALAVADVLGLPLAQAARVLSDFRGAGRRFEVRGESAGVTVIDDYAHHPTEIRATLSAARARYPGRRLWVVWQPHTYSRTRTLFQDFLGCFADADHVRVTPVYAAREGAPADGFSSRQVVEAMHHPDAQFVNDLDQAVEELRRELQVGDVLLVLSAGDADQVSTRVLQALQEAESLPLK